MLVIFAACGTARVRFNGLQLTVAAIARLSNRVTIFGGWCGFRGTLLLTRWPRFGFGCTIRFSAQLDLVPKPRLLLIPWQSIKGVALWRSQLRHKVMLVRLNLLELLLIVQRRSLREHDGMDRLSLFPYLGTVRTVLAV